MLAQPDQTSTARAAKAGPAKRDRPRQQNSLKADFPQRNTGSLCETILVTQADSDEKGDGKMTENLADRETLVPAAIRQIENLAGENVCELTFRDIIR